MTAWKPNPKTGLLRVVIDRKHYAESEARNIISMAPIGSLIFTRNLIEMSIYIKQSPFIWLSGVQLPFSNHDIGNLVWWRGGAVLLVVPDRKDK